MLAKSTNSTPAEVEKVEKEKQPIQNIVEGDEDVIVDIHKVWNTMKFENLSAKQILNEIDKGNFEISGKGNSELTIYGNALDVLERRALRKNIRTITFQYIPATIFLNK